MRDISKLSAHVGHEVQIIDDVGFDCDKSHSRHACRCGSTAYPDVSEYEAHLEDVQIG